MEDQSRNNAEEEVAVGVVPNVNVADAPVPPVAHDPASAEAAQGDAGASLAHASAEEPEAGETPVPQRPRTTGESPSNGSDPAATYLPAGASDAAPGNRGAVLSWFDRQRDDLIRDALVGLVVGIVVLLGAMWWDNQIADRQEGLTRELAGISEVQENTRFIRQVVADGAVEKPFRGLNLRSAALSGLDLGCDDLAADPPTGCTDLREADLTGANMWATDLAGADLSAAKLTGTTLANAHLTDADLALADLTDARLDSAILSGANLLGATLVNAHLDSADLDVANLQAANLTRAELIFSNLKGADLSGANLTAANLSHADLSSADLRSTCYDDSTTWPDGFEPPEPPACNLRSI
jgi:uncharacterized protein YjbI with pentapeptide repeats